MILVINLCDCLFFSFVIPSMAGIVRVLFKSVLDSTSNFMTVEIFMSIFAYLGCHSFFSYFEATFLPLVS